MTAAAIITWISSGLMGLLLLASGAYLLADPDRTWRLVLERQPSAVDDGLTESTLVAGLCVMLAFGLLWCVLASVIAVFAMMGRRWAHPTMVAVVGISAVVLVLFTVVQPLFAPLLVAAVVALALLLRPQSQAWFRRAGRVTRR